MPPSVPNGISILRLRAQLRGRVVTPDDPTYDQARAICSGGFDRRPQVIVQAADRPTSHVSSRWLATPGLSRRCAAAATARLALIAATALLPLGADTPTQQVDLPNPVR